MILKASTLLLFPFLIVQGYKVKKNTLRLPEPQGERKGQSSEIDSHHKDEISILILGDSAAAGVGVDEQSDALSGHIVEGLSERHNIRWQLEAKTGYTSAQLIKHTQDLNNQHFDIVITSIGVNDVTKLTSAKTWMSYQRKLYRLINEKFSPKMMIVTGVPPMNHFPALPNPLAWLFGQYAKAMNKNLAQFVRKTENMYLIEYDFEQYRALNLSMAIDGFHPSREVYQYWANQIVECILMNYPVKNET